MRCNYNNVKVATERVNPPEKIPTSTKKNKIIYGMQMNCLLGSSSVIEMKLS